MTEEIKINKKDTAACNWCKACDYYKDLQRLKQENEKLKKGNIKVKKEFNNLITEIISDIEYTGEIACNGESPIEHLHKCQKALKTLEEIREVLTVCEEEYCCEMCKYCNECKELDVLFPDVNETILKRINEVLR